MNKKILPCLLFGLFFCIPVYANILNVPDEYSTIQEGVDASVHGDTVLVAPGEYFENVYIYMKYITIASHYIFDHNPETIVQTIINGSQYDNDDYRSCIFAELANETASIEGFSLTGGSGSVVDFMYVAGTYREGGAITTRYSSLKICNNYFFDNSVTDLENVSGAGGGAISTSYGEPIIENNLFFHNIGLYAGAIVCNYSTAIIRNNIIVANYCAEYHRGSGALIVFPSDGISTVTNNTIVNNSCGVSYYIDGLAVAHDGSWSGDVLAENNIFYNPGLEMASWGTGAGGAEFRDVDANYNIVEGGYEGTENLDVDSSLVFAQYQRFLAENSPAIDAGNPDELFNDVENPEITGHALLPSLGGLRNDIGAYGGPYVDPSGFPDFTYFSKILDDNETHTVNNLADIKIFPNPSNSHSSISVDLLRSDSFEINIYDILGRKVFSFDETTLVTGKTIFSLNSANLSSGIYFLNLRSVSGQTFSKKFTVLK